MAPGTHTWVLSPSGCTSLSPPAEAPSPAAHSNMAISQPGSGRSPLATLAQKPLVHHQALRSAPAQVDIGPRWVERRDRHTLIIVPELTPTPFRQAVADVPQAFGH